MDFDIATYHHQIVNVLRMHRDLLPLHGSIDTIAIALLGIGEHNLVLHITVNEEQYLTMRIAYDATFEHALPLEFAILQRVPEGFGPRPFYLDTSRKELPYAFTLLSYVPGTTLAHWSESHMRLHATKVARLHEQRLPSFSTREGTQSTRPYSIYQAFQSRVSDMSSRYPQLFEIDIVKRLLPRLASYFRENDKLFTPLTSFPLIHGDLCASNILFYEDEVNYIDWEYMRYGDGAWDLAQLGWDIANPPWQLEMSASLLNAFLSTCLSHHPDPTFAERRAAWVTYLKFSDHLGYRLKAQQSDDAIHALPREHYMNAVQRIMDSLAQQFL